MADSPDGTVIRGYEHWYIAKGVFGLIGAVQLLRAWISGQLRAISFGHIERV